MANNNWKSQLWSAAGVILSVLVLVVVSAGFKGDVWVTDSQGITASAEAVMTSVRNGDWDDLSLLVSGGVVPEPAAGEDASAESLIWNAYLNSLQWEAEETFRVDDCKVKQNVTVTCLDIPAAADAIMVFLEQTDPENEDRGLALRIAAEHVLQFDLPMKERKVTMTFLREDSQWKLLPDNALLALLSGFTAA